MLSNSCGYYGLCKFPCVHVVFVFKEKKVDYFEFVSSKWRKHMFLEASSPLLLDFPVTTMKELESSMMLQPLVSKKRGRPKVNRKSQSSTIELDSTNGKRKRCEKCKGIGHNKRSCDKEVGAP